MALTLQIRPVRVDDAERLVDLHNRCSEQARYFPFHAAKPQPPGRRSPVGATVLTGSRWSAEDACADHVLDLDGARAFKVEWSDGAGHLLPYEEPDRMAEIILSAGLETEGGAS